MKTFITLFLCFTMVITALAQNPDKALARVRYTFSHIQDTTHRDKPFTENMLLVIGKNASVFTSYDRINRGIEMQKQIQAQIKEQTGNNRMNLKVTGQPLKESGLLDYYFFVKENKLITKERIFNNYLIEEDAPRINWKLTSDTSSFSGVKCQKATAFFKGRNWIAWYASDLPFASGPWKLNGLPGLIIEAYDENKEVQFLFAGIENIVSEPTKVAEKSEGPKIVGPNGAVPMINIMGLDPDSYLGPEIKLPEGAIKTTRKEIDKLKAARDKDPQGFIKAQMAAQGVQIMGSRSADVKIVGGPDKITINNPVELPEKK